MYVDTQQTHICKIYTYVSDIDGENQQANIILLDMEWSQSVLVYKCQRMHVFMCRNILYLGEYFVKCAEWKWNYKK